MRMTITLTDEEYQKFKEMAKVMDRSISRQIVNLANNSPETAVFLEINKEKSK